MSRPPAHWVHPTQNFYGPDAADAPAPRDLEHLLVADNAIVVSYRADGPREIRERLRHWVPAQVAAIVVADPGDDAPPVQARISTAKLTCDGVDIAQLDAFAAKRGTGQVAPHSFEG